MNLREHTKKTLMAAAIIAVPLTLPILVDNLMGQNPREIQVGDKNYLVYIVDDRIIADSALMTGMQRFVDYKKDGTLDLIESGVPIKGRPALLSNPNPSNKDQAEYSKIFKQMQPYLKKD
jgi:hypothetical protein